MKRLGLFILCASVALAAAVSPSRSDSSDNFPGMPTSEPGTQSSGTVEVSSSHSRWSPGDPYAQDPSALDYHALPLQEQAVVDRAMGNDDAREHAMAIYAIAAQEQFEAGVPRMAQLRLGLEGLDEIGVVNGIHGNGAGGTPGHDAASFGGNGTGTGGGGGNGTGGGRGPRTGGGDQ